MEAGLTITAEQIKTFAAECGFELAGVAPVFPLEDFRVLIRGVRQVWRAKCGILWIGEAICGAIHETCFRQRRASSAWESSTTPIGLTPRNSWRRPGLDSRYAWGDDYHDAIRRMLELLLKRLRALMTNRLNRRSASTPRHYSKDRMRAQTGLGWIGKNTCLINQEQGSWFFLGEILLSIPVVAATPQRIVVGPAPLHRCVSYSRDRSCFRWRLASGRTNVHFIPDD